MSIAVECPGCGKSYNVGDQSIGARATCKSCGASFTVSMSADQAGKPDATPRPADKATSESAAKAKRRPGGEKMPEKLGQFVLQKKLGAGAMGVVYLARDSILDREVAIKILPASLSRDEGRLKRFLREAKSAARLHHTNVAAVYQAGAEGRLAYIAMEYVDGKSLDKTVSKHGPLPWREATRVICDAAAGLGADGAERES